MTVERAWRESLDPSPAKGTLMSGTHCPKRERYLKRYLERPGGQKHAGRGKLAVIPGAGSSRVLAIGLP